MGINRRDFLRSAAGAASAAALAGVQAGTQGDAQALPSPSASEIDHIVVVMMENRSFDHFLGWLPGSRGKQAGLSYLDSEGDEPCVPWAAVEAHAQRAFISACCAAVNWTTFLGLQFQMDCVGRVSDFS